MKADPASIAEIFYNRLRFCVPIFQRHYVWEREKQWEPLWEDILAKASARLEGAVKTYPHYMGAVVLEARDKHSTKKVRPLNVIDGQQRLTTLQVFLAAVRDIALQRDYVAVSTDIEQYQFNRNPELMDDADVEIYKVWPTRFDRALFSTIIGSRSRSVIRREYSDYFPIGKDRLKKVGYIPPLLGAYIYFYDQLEAFIDSGEPGDELSTDLEPEDMLDAIYRAFLEDFRIVEIQLEEGDDAQVIFETLNDRGTPLLASDLIRNFIFYRAEASDENAVKLYDKHWSIYEGRFWSEEEKQGRMKRSRIEFFMQHFLSSRTAHETNLTKLFQEYKTFIQHSNPYASIEDELIDLNTYSPIYSMLVHPEGDTFFAKFAKDLGRWDLTTVFPLVLQIMATPDLLDAEKERCLDILLSYIVRRAVCRKTTKNYNNLFLQGVRHLNQNGVGAEQLQEFFASFKSETNVWPTDDEFKQAWLSEPIYEHMLGPRLQYILREIESAERTSLSEDVEVKSWLTIEHVMPQSWLNSWPLADGRTVTTEMHWAARNDVLPTSGSTNEKIRNRDRLINTIGNLTLLTRQLNSSVSNGPFDAKRKEIVEQSALAMNRYFNHVPDWDEERIVTRGEHLFKHALNTWQRPS
ncbi:DUF262 domain-containing protein [Pacificispira sp.]|uniref:DUF262 domain-containing protein n=1 Tax=Pacificispira sp. TaxID=2888761 RepID=UPI003B52BE78